jgi:oligoendopeptidase F
VHVNANDEEEYRLDAIDMDGLSNGLDRENILGIATAVTDSYCPISQRFYKLLAKMLGKQSIDYNDRLQNPIEIDDVKFPYVEAVQMILNTLYQFSEEMAVTGLQIMNDGKLVHAKPMEGKDSGAFCIRGIKPFIFLNYRGGYNSVITFAHEFGHAIHHVLSEMNAGLLNDGTPISMSEVASIFNEKLIFNKLLSDGELTDKERLYLLIEDVNRQIADIHRQIAFSKFEARAFRERKSGELSEERFTQIYSEEMERYLGFPLQDDAKFGWMGIPHIFNSPFYVRYYAFAGMVVNKLWQVYKSGKLEDFDEKYVDMLSNTGVESIEDLLEPFGLDINSPDFWSSALEPISAEIDEIERLAKLEGLL